MSADRHLHVTDHDILPGRILVGDRAGDAEVLVRLAALEELGDRRLERKRRRGVAVEEIGRIGRRNSSAGKEKRKQ